MNIIDKPHASPQSEAVQRRARKRRSCSSAASPRALGATWPIPLVSDHRSCRGGDRSARRPAGKLSADASLPYRNSISRFLPPNPAAIRTTAPFSINEIVDPAILDVVYDQLDLGKYEVDRNQFYNSFSIRPFVLANCSRGTFPSANGRPAPVVP